MNKEPRRRTRANESLINIFRGMKNRTIYSKLPNHQRNYIDKGIRICDEWLADAAEFDRWALANRWKEGLTIDRIDHRLGYEPGNCQFITQKANNRKATGTKLTQADVEEVRARYVRPRGNRGGNSMQLAAEYGVHRNTILDAVRGVTWQPE